MVLATVLRPLPGYPFTLDVAISYALDGSGLTVATTATNLGDTSCPYAAGQHPYLAAGSGLIDHATLTLDAASWLPTDERGLPTGTEPVEGSPFDFRAGRPLGDPHVDYAFTDLARQVHEPLIPKWMFDEINKQRQINRGSRPGHELNRHPMAKMSYVLRGHVLHTCGRRMSGVVSKNFVYYRCDPRINDRDRPDRFAGHPRTVNLSERAILDAIQDFYRDRVFGSRRREFLVADLDGSDNTAARQRERDRQRHQRALIDITRRQKNLMRQAQDAEPWQSPETVET